MIHIEPSALSCMLCLVLARLASLLSVDPTVIRYGTRVHRDAFRRVSHGEDLYTSLMGLNTRAYVHGVREDCVAQMTAFCFEFRSSVCLCCCDMQLHVFPLRATACLVVRPLKGSVGKGMGRVW